MERDVNISGWSIVKNYRNDDLLRRSFNELAKQVFGIDFEPWYQKGYWTDNYQPYSITEENRVVANVSVNRTNMLYNGKKMNLIQLGTVMTASEYRRHGLIRTIMNEIEKDFASEADGWYLWANDTVLDFYPKFGFVKSNEYHYCKEVNNLEEASVKQINLNDIMQLREVESIVENSAVNFRFQTVDNSGLTMFYLAGFMQEQIYYDEKNRAYIVAEIENGNLFIYGVYSKKKVDLDQIISAFGKNVRRVTLGFTPLCTEGYQCEKIQEADRTFFIKGDIMNLVENERMMFPELGHA